MNSPVRFGFAGRLLGHFHERRDKPVWHMPGTVRRYADLEREIRRAQAGLARLGVSPGSFVVLALASDWHRAAYWLAAFLMGARPMNAAVTPSGAERSAIAACLGAHIWVDDAVLQSRAADAVPLDHIRVSPEPSGYVVFSSGSTGAPKAVFVSAHALESQLSLARAYLRFDGAMRLYNALPATHTDGFLQGIVCTVSEGGTLYRGAPFHPTRAAQEMDTMASHKITHVIGNPTLFKMMARYAERRDYFAHDGFVGLISSASHLDAKSWDEIERALQAPLINEYGMSETVFFSHLAGPHPGMGPRHSIGLAVGCDAEIRDSEGRPCAPGVVGALWVRGDSLFTGYLTGGRLMSAKDRDGWFATKDLASRRADGVFDYHGRADDVIVCGGYKISPHAIEDAALRAPGVSEAYCAGVADHVFGEIPSLWVAPDTVCEDDLGRVLASALPQEARPRKIVRVPALPRTASGKIDKLALTDRHPVTITGADAAPRTRGVEEFLALCAQEFMTDNTALRLDMTPDAIAGWDSYAHVALLLALEDHFGVQIALDQSEAVETLGDLWACLTQAVDAHALPPHETVVIALPNLGGQSRYARLFMPDASDQTQALLLHMAMIDVGLDASFAERSQGFAEHIAARYAPQTRIALVGHSYAGLLAHDVAVTLAQTYERAVQLVILDAAAPTLDDADPQGFDRDADILSYAKYLPINVAAIDPQYQAMVRGAYAAMVGHVPRVFSGPALVLRAQTQGTAAHRQRQDLGWGAFVQGRLDVATIPGDHNAYQTDPAVAATIKRAITDWLARIDAA